MLTKPCFDRLCASASQNVVRLLGPRLGKSICTHDSSPHVWVQPCIFASTCCRVQISSKVWNSVQAFGHKEPQPGRLFWKAMSSEATASAVPVVAPAADRLTELKAARQALKRQLAQATREVKSQDTDCGPVSVVGTATMPCGNHQCHCTLPSCPINQSCTINHTSSTEHCVD